MQMSCQGVVMGIRGIFNMTSGRTVILLTYQELTKMSYFCHFVIWAHMFKYDTLI